MAYRLKPRASVQAEILDGEAVVICYETGKYHSARGGGAAIIDALTRGPVDLDKLTLSFLYEGVTEADTRESIRLFLEGLKQEAIAEEFEGETPDAQVPSEWIRQGLRTFTMETHAEMADVITLDPIHDVSESGWPERNPERR